MQKLFCLSGTPLFSLSSASLWNWEWHSIREGKEFPTLASERCNAESQLPKWNSSMWWVGSERLAEEPGVCSCRRVSRPKPWKKPQSSVSLSYRLIHDLRGTRWRYYIIIITYHLYPQWLSSLLGAFLGSVSCPRTFRDADGKDWDRTGNLLVGGFRSTLSHSCPQIQIYRIHALVSVEQQIVSADW